MMKRLFIVAALSMYFFSCHTEGEEFDILSFGACNDALLSDSLVVATNLVGTWTWSEQWCPTARPTKADKTVMVIFEPDATFSTSENSSITATGRWELKRIPGGFGLYLGQQIPGGYLDGFVTTCNDQLVSDLTPLDGCKHLFVKMQ